MNRSKLWPLSYSASNWTDSPKRKRVSRSDRPGHVMLSCPVTVGLRRMHLREHTSISVTYDFIFSILVCLVLGRFRWNEFGYASVIYFGTVKHCCFIGVSIVEMPPFCTRKKFTTRGGKFLNCCFCSFINMGVCTAEFALQYYFVPLHACDLVTALSLISYCFYKYWFPVYQIPKSVLL